MVERVSSGIPGLDDMIEGGFKKNSNVLLVGGCGAGKSTFGIQYLIDGAGKGEPGVYITFEEEQSQIYENMLGHGWDLTKLVDNNLIRILRIEPQDVMHIVRGEYGMIVDAINQLNAKRVVIDSVTSIEMMIESNFEQRQGLLKLTNWLRGADCTSILIYERNIDPTGYAPHGSMETIVDGVIMLYNFRRGKSRVRALEVLKMRGTRHITNLVPYIIDQGVSLQPHQTVFGEMGDHK